MTEAAGRAAIAVATALAMISAIGAAEGIAAIAAAIASTTTEVDDGTGRVVPETTGAAQAATEIVGIELIDEMPDFLHVMQQSNLGGFSVAHICL